MTRKKNTPPSSSAGRNKKVTKKPAAKTPAETVKKQPAKQAAKVPSRKSKSEIGRTVQTRDEYFEGQRSYRKEGYEEKGNYRKAVVIAQFNDDLALVKLTKGSLNGIPLIDEEVSKYKPYVETKDSNNNPIRYGKKFIRGKKNLSKKDTAKIAIDCFKGDGDQKKKNRNKVREMKGRPPNE